MERDACSKLVPGTGFVPLNLRLCSPLFPFFFRSFEKRIPFSPIPFSFHGLMPCQGRHKTYFQLNHFKFCWRISLILGSILAPLAVAWASSSLLNCSICIFSNLGHLKKVSFFWLSCHHFQGWQCQEILKNRQIWSRFKILPAGIQTQFKTSSKIL